MGELNVITRIFIREIGKQEIHRQRGDVVTEAEVGVMYFEDGGRNLHGMQETSRSWKRQQNRFCPRTSRRNVVL